MMLSVTVSGRVILNEYSLCSPISEPPANSAIVSVSEKMIFDCFVGAPFMGLAGWSAAERTEADRAGLVISSKYEEVS